MPMSTSQDHASPQALAAYLDQTMTPGDRVRLAEHLAECADCRADLVTAGRVLRSRGETARRIAAAAVVILVGVGVAFVSRQPRERDELLRASGSVTQAVIVYAPLGEVPRPGLRFTWAATAPGALYRLTVSGPTGATLWSVSTRDTTVTPSADLALSADVQYSWLVDALASDGTTRSSGLRSFSIRP